MKKQLPMTTKLKMSLTFATIALGFNMAPASAEPAEGRFEKITPCPFKAAKDFDQSRLECGFLNVPENRASKDSDNIRIPVAIIRSQNSKKNDDPVVFLHGGPGGAPLASAGTYRLFGSHLFQAQRDIIIYNQRGSLLVEPSLDCSEVDKLKVTAYSSDLTLEQRDALISKTAKDCLQSLSTAGRDLVGYSSIENARDLHELRLLLGIKRWNLMAVSYGSLMAIEAAKEDPTGVRSLILDSIVSPKSDVFMSDGNRNFSNAINRITDACGQDKKCAETFPDLSQSLEQLIAKLDSEPMTVSVAGKVGEPAQKIVVNWHDFLNLTHWMLYNAKTLRLVPLLIDSTNNDDPTLLTFLSTNVFPAPKNAAPSAAGSLFAIVCEDQYRNQETSHSALSNLKRYDGFSITSFMADVCASLPNKHEKTTLSTSFKSDIPTLLLSGYFDPMTPDAYAEEVANGLSNVTQVVIKNYGHSTLSGYTECQTKLASAFLNDLGNKSNFPCLSEIKQPVFATSLEEAMGIFAPK